MNESTVAVLRAALDTLTGKIAVINPAGRIVLVNECWRARAQDSFGLSKFGVGESFFDAVERSTLRCADALRLVRGVTAVLASRRRAFSFECRQRLPSSQKWFSIEVTSAEICGWVHACIDVEEITMAKLARRDRAASEQRVRRIKAKAERHVRMIAALRESGRLKDEFIATLAHELRNPLAPIVSAAELLAASSADRQVSIHACQVIRRQIQMLTRLVDDLLDMSRIVCGSEQLHMQPVDLRSIIAAAVETARPLIDQHEHTLKIRIRKQPLVVEGDALRLTQVVANLLNNAVKYTNPGGRITIVAAHIGAAAVLRVRDTGIGLSHQQLAGIFELFAQAAPGSKRTLGGLGVGLALARKLAERHGGSLTGYSDGPGRGSEFTLTLRMCPYIAKPVEPEALSGTTA